MQQIIIENNLKNNPMYLTTLTIATYILASIFLFFLVRTFGKGKLKNLWEQAKKQVDQVLKNRAKIQRAKDSGMKEFTVDGRTYLANTHLGAIYTHKQFLKAEKSQKAAIMQLKTKHLKPKKDAILRKG